jgi:translocation protein SEC63
MAGAQFEYDESGATAYYFFMSFLAMILIPMTYVLWPVSRRKDNILKSKKQERYISKWKTAVLAIGWCLLAFLAYRTSYLETEKVVFDPYEILEVDRVSSGFHRPYSKQVLGHFPNQQ